MAPLTLKNMTTTKTRKPLGNAAAVLLRLNRTMLRTMLLLFGVKSPGLGLLWAVPAITCFQCCVRESF